MSKPIKIDVEQIRREAEEMYAAGGFSCSETVVLATMRHLDPDMPERMVAAATGFAMGVGRSKCLCGAVTGGAMCLGYMFGRTRPNEPGNEKCLALVNEMQESFRQAYKGVLCCHVYLQDVEFASPERKARCGGFVGQVAGKVAEIVARELGARD